MTMPPDYLLPLLKSIETKVLDIHTEFPKLSSKEIEVVYGKLGKYFKSCISNKGAEEPYTPSDRSQALIDEILNVIDEREEEELDAFIINNPETRHGEHLIPSLSHLYIYAFKILEKSAKNWRKQNGPKGYVNFIQGFIIRES